MKVVCIIQARVGSTRLPGKVLKSICGKTVLEHDVDRLKRANSINEIIIATTIEERDIEIVNEAKRLGIKYYRGSEKDVLSRYYHAGKDNNADIIVRVTSDCPCIDSNIIDSIVYEYIEKSKRDNIDYINNTLELTFPRGYDVEVFSFKSLEIAFKEATQVHEREHVTPYIYCNKDKFRIHIYRNQENYSNIRLTLDTPEDFKVITDVYEKLYYNNNFFGLKDVIKLYKQEPGIFSYNKNIDQKRLKD